MRLLETDHGMRDMADYSSIENSAVPPGKRPTPRGPAEDPPGRLVGKFQSAQFTKNNRWGQGNKTVRQGRVCVAFKERSETRYIYQFYAVPRHKGICFEKYHTLKHY